MIEQNDYAFFHFYQNPYFIVFNNAMNMLHVNRKVFSVEYSTFNLKKEAQDPTP